ncbi:hypothetical protein [Okeania sp. KiyG1]|uniref:hypothetical protein n=1 Tax=Okeania sp. KiyG1 TaxID=2720165 RepID=UPI00192121C1|nr:hypothetical protein [Okeania sp. KiyG1]GGA53184.1 hypothetical protein CYANOKiyG1_73220 [Okeania sp. KiyG1]
MTVDGDREIFQVRMTGSLTDVQERDLFLTLWLKSIGFVRDSSIIITPDLSDPTRVTISATWLKQQ